MALDGVMIDVPETPENLQYYGKPEGGTRRPFPADSRTVGLAEAGARAVIAVQLGTIYRRVLSWCAFTGGALPSASATWVISAPCAFCSPARTSRMIATASSAGSAPRRSTI